MLIGPTAILADDHSGRLYDRSIGVGTAKIVPNALKRPETPIKFDSCEIRSSRWMVIGFSGLTARCVRAPPKEYNTFNNISRIGLFIRQRLILLSDWQPFLQKTYNKLLTVITVI